MLNYRQVEKLSEDIVMSILSLADKDFTDDKQILKRHRAEMKAKNKTSYEACYCLRPIVGLGGSEEKSEIYVGNIKPYMEIISQAGY